MPMHRATKSEQPCRAALYMRVSTGAQAERELSIPDQRHQLRAYCEKRGWPVVEEFKDARTGTDGNRAGFKRMLAAAEEGRAPFDVIVVHSYSRFYRDGIESELCLRALGKRGIRVISITQEFEDTPIGEMVRRIVALFDEYDSKETGKHVSRSMAENARQGFFSGGTPPFGFEAVTVERRGKTNKKKLVPKEEDAEVVRLIFDLYLKGDGTSGSLGVKKIVEWLNDHGYSTRGGARWGIGPLQRLLRDPVYKGEYWRNCRGEDEPILVPVPSIVSAEIFDLVQQNLTARNPKNGPAQNPSGPILLSGLATCATCGSGMLISTGKSGRYRYYACGGRVRQGKGTCQGRRVRMEETDDLVLSAIMDDMLTPSRMTKLLEELHKRQTARDSRKAGRLEGFQEKLTDAETRLRRLYDAVERGHMDLSDPTLRERVDAVRSERDTASKAVALALAELEPEARLTEEKIASFVHLMRTNLSQGDVKRRRAYLRAVVDNIEIDQHEIRILQRDASGMTTPFQERKSSAHSVPPLPKVRHLPFPAPATSRIERAQAR